MAALPYDAAMSDSRPIDLSPQGPPTTVLDQEPAGAIAALDAALQLPPDHRRDAIASVCARWPAFLEAWAELGDHARDPVEAYACYRVGYHRGLDRLRANGWRGSGYVRWRDRANHGFLRSLQGLGRTAAAIGESAEAARCETFLLQCDPAGPPPD